MRIEALSSNHDRASFSCGDRDLNRFLHEIALQGQRKGVAATFVVIDDEAPSRIVGYYTLSNYVVEGVDLPEALRRSRKLPRHAVPSTLLGRLAIDSALQGRGIGAMLLVDALKRSYRASRDVGSVCVIVQAKNERLAAYYESFGFVALGGETFHLAMAMDTIARLI
ncbi:MAG: GNAT family N-acetyltransferase [Vulcanimicrobiaceae bacterium]